MFGRALSTRTVLLLTMVVVSVVWAATPAAAAGPGTVVVDDDGAECNEDFASINDAIRDADTTAGDTILVCSGTYQESVWVDKSVDIVAANDSDGTGQPRLLGTYDETIGINVRADDVTIDGFAVAQYADGDGNGEGILVDGQRNVTINDTRISDVDGRAVSIGQGAADVDVTNGAFSNTSTGVWIRHANDVTVDTVGINDSDRGIVVGPAGAGEETRNVDVSNVFINNSSIYGFYVAGGTGGTIHDVTLSEFAINDTNGHGIFLLSTDTDGQIENVSIETGVLGNNDVGIKATVDATSDNPFVDVNVRNVLFDLQGPDNAIEVAHDGEKRMDFSVRRTIVEGDPDAENIGLRLSKNTNASGIDYRLNVLRNVDIGVSNNNPGSVINARQNYWGSDDGPSTQGQASTSPIVDPVSGELANGSGAAVTEGEYGSGVSNVIFDPWLGKPTCTGADGQLIDVGEHVADFPEVDGVPTNQLLPICVWERAALPLRTTDDTATTTIRLPSIGLKATDTNRVSINKRSIPIYQSGKAVNVDFSDAQGADTDLFANDDAQVLILRSDGDRSVPGIGDVDFDDETLTAELTPDGFSAVEVRDVTLDGSGNVQFSHTPSDTGEYAYVLVRNRFGDGLSKTSTGTVTVNGGIDVVGVELALVQETTASATPKEATVTAGDNVTLDVDSKLGGPADGTTHTVLLYNDSTLSVQRLDLQFDGTVEEVLRGSADVSVETTIENLDGTFLLQEDLTIAGITFEATSSSGSLSVADLIAEATDVTLTSDATTLNTSMTVHPDEPADSTVEIGTRESFTPGEYEYVYIAEQGGDVSTTEGTVTVESPSDTGGDDSKDGGGSDGDGSDDGGSTPDGGTTVPSGGTGGGGQPPADTVEIDVTRDGNVTRIQVENAKAGEAVVIDSADDAELDRLGFDLERVQFTPAVDGAFELTVRRHATVSGATPPLDDGIAEVGYVVISHPNPESDFERAQLTFRVAQERLDRGGTWPDDLVTYRYNDGQYNLLPTSRLTGTSEVYRYRADSPGLSVFALGSSPADMEVTSARLSDDAITAGDVVDVTAQIENDGGSAGTKTVELRVDGAVVDTRDVDVPAGERRTVTFTRSFDEPGSYDIAVDDATAGTLTVEAASDGTPTERPTESPTEEPPTVTEETESRTPTERPDDGPDVVLIGLALTLLIVLVVAGTLAYQRYEEQR